MEATTVNRHILLKKEPKGTHMIFHYVSAGESVLSIAREHGVSPVRLIEENALADPDRLAVGQCLAIYRSSRSYTVRGGDTFEGILRRFGTNAHELLKFNPGIGEKRLLYPGQALSLGRVETSYGPLTVNGYVNSSVSMTKLRTFSSALTYLTIINSSFSDRSGFRSQKERDLVDFSAQNGILPLLLLRPFGDPDALAESIAKAGYRGAELHGSDSEKGYEPYSDALKRAGLISVLPYSEGANGGGCSWLSVRFGDHRVPIENRFSELSRDTENTYRMMPELPYSAVEISASDGRCLRTMPLSDCARLAYRRNAPISERGDGKMSFHYSVTVSGRHERREVCFDDLATIKKGLAVLGESGICGVSVYPEWCPEGLPTLVHRMFDVIKS